MDFMRSAISAHNRINQIVPQTEIEYAGKKYAGYMNSQDITLDRHDGGYINQRDKIIHIRTDDDFTIGDPVIFAGARFKITAITSNFLYKTLTITADLYASKN